MNSKSSWNAKGEWSRVSSKLSTEAQSEALRKYFLYVGDSCSNLNHMEVQAQQKHFVDKVKESTSWLQMATEEWRKERDRHDRSFEPNYSAMYPNLFLKRTERKTCHEKVIIPQERYNHVGGRYQIINGKRLWLASSPGFEVPARQNSPKRCEGLRATLKEKDQLLRNSGSDGMGLSK